jgi:hypothetical protein
MRPASGGAGMDLLTCWLTPEPNGVNAHSTRNLTMTRNKLTAAPILLLALTVGATVNAQDENGQQPIEQTAVKQTSEQQGGSPNQEAVALRVAAGHRTDPANHNSGVHTLSARTLTRTLSKLTADPIFRLALAIVGTVNAQDAIGQQPVEPRAEQQGGTPNQEAFALRVAAAHRPDHASHRIEAFRSTIELELKDATLDKGGQVALDVAFLEFQAENRKRPTTLLRYEVRGAEQPIVRGQDKYGPWHISNGKPQDLTGAGSERDLKAFLEHKNLAKQLVRFLAPGDVIRSLNNCTDVREQKLQLTRSTFLDTLAIDGDIDQFPMMRNAGEEVPARLTVYVDRKTDRLVAVDVTPIKKGVLDENNGERIKLDKLEERNGLLVPSQLHYLWRDPRGQLRSHSSVNIIKLDLKPDLKKADFDRSR